MNTDALQKQVDTLLQRVERLEAVIAGGRKSRLQCLESVVCRELSVTPEELRGESFERRITDARHLLWLIAKTRYQIPERSLQIFTKKSRGAVQGGIISAKRLMEGSNEVACLVETLVQRAETERSLT